MEILLLLMAVLAVAGFFGYRILGQQTGPGHCMGCGKCEKDGICILTGKPLTGKKKPTDQAE